MYKEWYAAEIFSQNFPIPSWVTGEVVRSSNEYSAAIMVFNPSQSDQANVKATFYYPDEYPQHYAFAVQPGCQGRLFMGANRPDTVPGCNPQKRFGMRIESTVPVVSQATVWDRIPGEPITNSMTTFMLHPGPLGSREKEWCLVDSFTVRSDNPLEEREWFTILNPNSQPVTCRLSFYRGSRVDFQKLSTTLEPEQMKPVDFSFGVPAESITSVLQSDFAGILPNKPYTVIAHCDLPVVMQGLRQIFTRGQYERMGAFAVLDAIPVGDGMLK